MSDVLFILSLLSIPCFSLIDNGVVDRKLILKVAL